MTVVDNPKPWRVVIFSVLDFVIPSFEQVLAERGHRLLALFTAPGPRTRRTDDYQRVADFARPDLDVVVSNQPRRWAALLRAYRPDLLVCVGYNWKLPQDVLDVPRLGAINFHAALLPKYRGPNSFGWALRNADPVVGWTSHYMSAEFDDGPVLARRSMPLTDNDDVDTLFDPYIALAPLALADALEKVAAGDPGTAQGEGLASEAPRFEPEWMYIDWNDSARDIHLKVRSWWGNRGETRGALGEVDGLLTRVVKTQLVQQDGHAPAAPGTVLERNGETLLIQCGDGPLRILRHYQESGHE
jgi:methionyl-tRNA formyltransferase